MIDYSFSLYNATSNMSTEESKQGSYYKQATVEVEGLQLQPKRCRTKRSRNQRAQYKKRRNQERQQQRAQPGCDAGGRAGGSIGLRRQEPPGWQLRQGCKCALHYGGECSEYIKNATDKPRRKRTRPSMPEEHLRCNRCHKIGHRAQDCYESRYEATRKRPRVECTQNDEKIFITIQTGRAATAESDIDDMREAQPGTSDSEENWDEPCHLGSPPPLEDGLENGDLEVRSVAEISEGEEDNPFSEDEAENPQPATVMPQLRLPTPESIIEMLKKGEQSLFRELAKRQIERQKLEMERAAEFKRMKEEAFGTIGTTAVANGKPQPEQRQLVRLSSFERPQPNSESELSQPPTVKDTLYDKLIRTIERAQSVDQGATASSSNQ